MNRFDLGRRFARDGFAVLEGFRSADALASLRARALALIDAFDPTEAVSVFSTKDDSARTDAYFLTSGDKIRFFLEDEAVDHAGRLTVPKDLAVNKICHALHDLDSVFDAFSHGSDLAEVAATIGLNRPGLIQSRYILKSPGIGGEVAWHQDAAFLVTTPASVTGFWFALEDADRDNGCLWVQPGGHRGPLRARYQVDGAGARLKTLDPTPWPSEAQALPVEVKAGTLIVFHGLMPHYSAPNRSDRSRHAYTLHAVDQTATYESDNWLKRDGLALRGFV